MRNEFVEMSLTIEVHTILLRYVPILLEKLFLSRFFQVEDRRIISIILLFHPGTFDFYPTLIQFHLAPREVRPRHFIFHPRWAESHPINTSYHQAVALIYHHGLDRFEPVTALFIERREVRLKALPYRS